MENAGARVAGRDIPRVNHSVFMNLARHYAERARALSYIEVATTPALERLFGECQAEALNYALVELNVPSVLRDSRQRKLASEADAILRGTGDKTKVQGTIG